MRLDFTLGKHHIRITFSAKRDWSEGIKKFRHESGLHYVFGRISIYTVDLTAEVYPVCAECGSADVGEVSSGDEGWTVCQSCCSIEQGYRYVTYEEFENAL
jgi:hypothetical protein